MNHAVQILIAQKAEISQEIEVLQDRLREARAKVKSIDEALVRLGSDETELLVGSKALKDLVAELVETHDEGLTPREISEKLSTAGRPTSPQSVSSTLSRLKAEGIADSTPSGRWIKKKAPPSREDDAKDLGPRAGAQEQRSTDLPEGSIPSGSTYRPSRDEIDDEIPF